MINYEVSLKPSQAYVIDCEMQMSEQLGVNSKRRVSTPRRLIFQHNNGPVFTCATVDR